MIEDENGSHTTYTYDAAGRLTAQNKASARATFTYDNVGNVTKKHHEGGDPQTFTYNAFGQIKTLHDEFGFDLVRSYTYDCPGAV